MPTARVFFSERVEPGCDLATASYLLSRIAEGVPAGLPVCIISRLTGQAVSLGRFQNPASALNVEECERRGIQIYRRLTGGRACWFGEGVLSLSLILPHPSALLTTETIQPAKVINRYVRGVLRGLTSLGLNALYYGGDFLAVNGKDAGGLGLEAVETGAVLFHALIGLARDCALPEGLSNYPPFHPPRGKAHEPTCLRRELGREITAEEVVEAILKGYQQKFQVDWERASFEQVTHTVPAPRESGRTLTGSGLYPIAWGYLEACVSLGNGNRLTEAKIMGDFMANSPAIVQLEQTLLGCPSTQEAITARVETIFADPKNFILGPKSPATISDALLSAIAKARGKGI